MLLLPRASFRSPLVLVVFRRSTLGPKAIGSGPVLAEAVKRRLTLGSDFPRTGREQVGGIH